MCRGIIVGGSVVAHGKIATNVKGVVCGSFVVCAKKMIVAKVDEHWSQS